MITITFFLPVIIQEFGASQLNSNLLSALPYGCALIIMMPNAIHSDIKKERLVCSCFLNNTNWNQVTAHYHPMPSITYIWYRSYYQHDPEELYFLANVLNLRNCIRCLGYKGTFENVTFLKKLICNRARFWPG